MMSEKEALMYKILLNLYTNEKLPIVSKGALITKLVLSEHNYKDVNRETKDIDLNWIGAPPKDLGFLKTVIDEAAKKVDPELYAVVDREYALNVRTAGISIRDKNDKEVVSIDIDVKGVTGSKVYYYETGIIRGVLPSEIIADKIAAMSGGKIFRRGKDLIDVYALTSCINVKTDEIYRISALTGNKIQSFDGFLNRISDLEHAYEKLRGIEGKPPFETVYAHLKTFLTPFIERDTKPREWDCGKKGWNSPEKPPQTLSEIKKAAAAKTTVA
jgi:hypothetical protein